jgi:hypothetical protein
MKEEILGDEDPAEKGYLTFDKAHIITTGDVIGVDLLREFGVRTVSTIVLISA